MYPREIYNVYYIPGYVVSTSPHCVTDISDGYSYGSDLDDVMLDNNCYVAAVSYTKQAQDELSVSEGQTVCVVDDSDQSKWRE